MKKIIKVPEYFKDLPDDANLNSRDVADIFGYAHTSINKAIDRGKIPKHDIENKCGSIQAFSKVKHGTRHVFWKVKTIREWIENVNRNIPK